MTKEESMVMKGVAILFMLYLHLFNQMSNVSLCVNLIVIDEQPLVYIFSRATSPVSFFIILSGYGLYISHRKGTYSVWRKLKGLFIHYWITLLIFVTLGSFIVSSRYPGNFVTFIKNVMAWDTSYNGELWFLFPYAMVMLTSKWIVKVLDRFCQWLCLGVTFFLSICTGYVISRYGAQYLYHTPLLYKPVLYIQFLFPFTIGTYMAKYKDILFARISGSDLHVMSCKLGLCIWLFLAVLVAFRCCFDTGSFHTLYVAAFIILFVSAPRPKMLDVFLLEMGRRSTSMWFVHSYFCYYFFHDTVYSLKYPIVIFISLALVSLLFAFVIDKLLGHLQFKKN